RGRAADHRVGRAIGLDLLRVAGGRDLELVLRRGRAAALLDGVRHLVCEQVQAERIARPELAVGEVDVLPGRVRARADRVRRVGRLGAGVDAHAGEVGGERRLEAIADAVGQRLPRRARGPGDRVVGARGDAVGVTTA